MAECAGDSMDRRDGRYWFIEPEVFFLTLFVVLAYFVRAGELPLRGEESTRAQMAFEMVSGNDFLVPRAQGQPFRIRPPLQMWAIAFSGMALGDWSEWTIRLHSLLASLATTVLVYGYARTFLGRLGALAAGAAFASFADWFQMGRQAETEAIFTLLLGGALLLWHWGIVRGWPNWVVFSLGYGLMASAMLAKGMQAPVYFVGATWLYMVVMGDWKRMFSSGHAAGLAVGAGVVAAWVVPYARELGWAEVAMVWTGDPAYKVNGTVYTWKSSELFRHLFTLPVELLAGTLPWSPLIFTVFRSDFRSSWPAGWRHVAFLWTCIGVALPSIWIPPGGLPRYFAPLLPCVAVLAGASVEWLQRGGQGRAWIFLRAVAALLMAGLGTVMAFSPWLTAFPKWAGFAEPVPVAMAYAGVVFLMAVVTAFSGRISAPAGPRVGIVCLAAAMAVYFSGFVMDFRVRRSESPAEAMLAIKAALPPGQKLVSFGDQYLAPLFAYHYGLPITTRRPWPLKVEDLPEDLEYFCFESHGTDSRVLPFKWKQIGVFPLDRYRLPNPVSRVVVGQRE